MNRILITTCLAGLLALPAVAQTQTPQPAPVKPVTAESSPAPINPAGATGMMSSQDAEAAATINPAAGPASTRKRAARADRSIDPEHAQIVELNRREMQRIQSGQTSR